MNPSAAQLLEAVEALGVDEVVMLPNNGNVVLTAEQAAAMSERRVEVVPTTLDAGRARGDGRLRSGGRRRRQRPRHGRRVDGVHSAEITYAVRDSEVDGVEVRKGQAIGLVDGRLVATGDDLEAVYAEVLETFAAGDAEIVTVLTSLDDSTRRSNDSPRSPPPLPELELDVHEGGQPLYPILVSAE